MVRHARVQCAPIRPQGTKDSTTRDPEVNHSTFNTHTHTHTHTQGAGWEDDQPKGEQRPAPVKAAMP